MNGRRSGAWWRRKPRRRPCCKAGAGATAATAGAAAGAAEEAAGAAREAAAWAVEGRGAGAAKEAEAGAGVAGSALTEAGVLGEGSDEAAGGAGWGAVSAARAAAAAVAAAAAARAGCCRPGCLHSRTVSSSGDARLASQQPCTSGLAGATRHQTRGPAGLPGSVGRAHHLCPAYPHSLGTPLGTVLRKGTCPAGTVRFGTGLGGAGTRTAYPTSSWRQPHGHCALLCKVSRASAPARHPLPSPSRPGRLQKDMPGSERT